MTKKEIQKALERYGKAKSRKSKTDSLRQEAGRYVWPSAQDMVRTIDGGAGLLRTIDLYDSTALMAAYNMTSGIFTYLMPVRTQWFSFTPTLPELKENMEVQEWISRAVALTHDEIWRSNFMREMFITIRSMIVFGTGVISVEKIDGEIIFKSHHIGYMTFDDNNKGEIDTAYRQIFYTVRHREQRPPGRAGVWRGELEQER